MSALMNAGLDYRRYTFGDADADRLFVVDGDRLIELPDTG